MVLCAERCIWGSRSRGSFDAAGLLGIKAMYTGHSSPKETPVVLRVVVRLIPEMSYLRTRCCRRCDALRVVASVVIP